MDWEEDLFPMAPASDADSFLRTCSWPECPDNRLLPFLGSSLGRIKVPSDEKHTSYNTAVGGGWGRVEA